MSEKQTTKRQRPAGYTSPTPAAALSPISTSETSLPSGDAAFREGNRPLAERSMSRILALKAAGFTNRDIIDAYKAGQLEELYALVEDAQQ